MAEKRDYYEVLEVAKTATVEELSLIHILTSNEKEREKQCDDSQQAFPFI